MSLFISLSPNDRCQVRVRDLRWQVRGGAVDELIHGLQVAQNQPETSFNAVPKVRIARHAAPALLDDCAAGARLSEGPPRGASRERGLWAWGWRVLSATKIHLPKANQPVELWVFQFLVRV